MNNCHTAKRLRIFFEQTKHIYESHLLTFKGIEGYDVYNCSIPFTFKGKRYLFGRIERRKEWARSWVRLFEQTGIDEWTILSNSMIYQLEDPFISFIHHQWLLGGTHVRYIQSKHENYYSYFYKGTDLNNLYYFTTGPNYMKDIRLVALIDGNIGVFSRPRNAKIHKLYGSESIIGFTTIHSLDELVPEIIENAVPIIGLFEADEWGGCNQCYLLDTGLIGVIGHKCYKDFDDLGAEFPVYMNIAFVFDPRSHQLLDCHIIGTRNCYPSSPSKLTSLWDVTFSSGIVMRQDGKVDLYSGIGDCAEGRIVIDYPFEGFGNLNVL